MHNIREENNMMYKKYLSFLFAILIVVLYFVVPGYVFAQSQSGIKIEPALVDDLVDPGEILIKELTVTNQSEADQVFYVYLKDFKAGDEFGNPVLVAPGSEEGYFLASWIQITNEAIEFGAGEEKTIKFQIHVPQEVGPGGYYGAIYLGSKPPRYSESSEDKGAGMTIAQQAGSLILLQVKGDVDEEAYIREFITDKNFYNSPFDVNFKIKIHNTGNVHVKPYGMITITNMLDKKSGEIVFNDKKANILPNSLRQFQDNWKGDWGIGRYKAEIGLTYGTDVKYGGQGKQTMYMEKTFWIIPWRIVGPILLSLLITIILFTVVVRYYKNVAVQRAIKKAGVKQARGSKRKTSSTHTSLNMLVVFVGLFLMFAVLFFLFFA